MALLLSLRQAGWWPMPLLAPQDAGAAVGAAGAEAASATARLGAWLTSEESVLLRAWASSRSSWSSVPRVFRTISSSFSLLLSEPGSVSTIPSLPVSFIVLLLLLSLSLFLLYLEHKMDARQPPSTPFPFMQLPPELRDMVYENLLEDPYYPPPPPCTEHNHASRAGVLGWLTGGGRQTRPGNCEPGRRPSQSNWIFLASKQTHAEFMDLLCKRRTFHLTVSPGNYPKAISPCGPPPLPTTTASAEPITGDTTSSSISSIASSPASTPTPANTAATSKIWNISPTTLAHLRRCDIKLITTSSMLGVPDPRTMPPASWALASQIRAELAAVDKVHELNLHVKAIGDPLWNPLWVWYHASQSFKSMGSNNAPSPSPPSPSSPSSPSSSEKSPAAASPGHGPGPRLAKISFSLDTWSPGENYLQRSAGPAGEDWEWRCARGHAVGADGGADVTVREFCARLYMECRVCRPELESEDEDEDGHGHGDGGAEEGDDDDDDDGELE